MNSTKYAFALFLKTLGINRKQTRMNEAAQELQLLREGEHLLGKTLWESSEEYEAVGVPYWHLRQLNNQTLELQKKIDVLSEELAQAQIQKKSISQNSNSLRHSKEEDRIQLVGKAERLTKEKKAITKKAQSYKRQHEGLKLKVQVLRKENSEESLIQPQIDKANSIKEQFLSLKQQNSEIDQQIQELEINIDTIEKEIRSEYSKIEGGTTRAFDDIGKANRNLSNFRAEIGLIRSQMNQHYTDLGHILSIQYKENSQCRDIAKKQKRLISILAALRRSIEWNNDLAERH